MPSSYSYDPTHTLQYNLAPNFGLPEKFLDPESPEWFEQGETETKVFDDDLDKTLLNPPEQINSEEKNKDENENLGEKEASSINDNNSGNQNGGIVVYI